MSNQIPHQNLKSVQDNFAASLELARQKAWLQFKHKGIPIIASPETISVAERAFNFAFDTALRDVISLHVQGAGIVAVRVIGYMAKLHINKKSMFQIQQDLAVFILQAMNDQEPPAFTKADEPIDSPVPPLTRE